MTQRTFIYNDITFPEPGAQYTNEQVRQHLASQFFPELNRCDVQVGEEKDGAVEVRFVKRVTTKGNTSVHLQALQTMPCEEPTPAPEFDIIAHFGESPTVADLLAPDNAEWIDQYVGYLEDKQVQNPDGYMTHQWPKKLPSKPLHDTIPSGF